MSYEPMGFSLKPPKFIRDAVSAVVRQVVGGTTITLPTGQVVSASDLPSVVAGARVNVNTQQPAQSSSPAAQMNATVERIPGGWITVAAAAIAGGLLLSRAMKRGRR